VFDLCRIEIQDGLIVRTVHQQWNEVLFRDLWNVPGPGDSGSVSGSEVKNW